MTSKTFVPGTVIDSAWLNDVDAVAYGIGQSSGAALVGWIRSIAGGVAATIAQWLNRQSPSIFDCMTAAEVADVLAGTLTLDVAAKIQLALDGATAIGAKTVTMRGQALIGTTITVPEGVTLRGDGNRASLALGSEGAPSALIKKSTLAGTGVTLSGKRSRLIDIGVFAQVGATGDGIWIAANYCGLSNVASSGHTGKGIHIGSTAAGYKNCNGWRLDNITASYNTENGVLVSDDFTAYPLNDANAGTFTGADLRENGGDGLTVDNCFGNTFVGILTEGNGGWGVKFTNKSFKNTFIGGDQDEGNTLGVVRNEGMYNAFIGILSSGFSDIGTYTNMLGFTTNSLVGTRFTGDVDLASGRLKFPAVAAPSTDSNTLDDYEEGAFTPTLTGSGTPTYVTQYGRYTKIGNLVTLYLNLSVTGATLNASKIQINGLPYPADGVGDPTQRGVGVMGGNWSGMGAYGSNGRFRVSSTPGSIEGIRDNAGASAYWLFSELGATSFSFGTTMSYFTA